MEKRFKIILVIAIVLFLSTYFMLFVLKNEELFLKGTFFLGIGIWLWFFSDYEMLRHSKYFLRCLVVSVIYAIYGIALYNQYRDADNVLICFGALHPLTLLVVQRPLRQLYLMLFKREPKVDKHGKFSDLIYTLILFISTIILPMLIIERIE